MSADIDDLAREYLRAVDEHEAAVESFLATCAAEYYQPGYLSDGEWALLKDLVRGDPGADDTMVVLKVAVYRKVFTEAGRAHELDGDWPAKGGDRDE